MKNKNRLGPEPKEKIDFEDYKNEWILVTLVKGDKLVGKLSYINGDKIGLLPYQKADPSEKGNTHYSIEHQGLPYMVQRNQVTQWRQTSEESVEVFCKNSNHDEETQRLSKMKNRWDLENQIKTAHEEINGKKVVLAPRMIRLIK